MPSARSTLALSSSPTRRHDAEKQAMTSNMRAVDHVQLPMPYRATPAARRFFVEDPFRNRLELIALQPAVSRHRLPIRASTLTAVR